MYEWIKVLHIVAVISWMVGLLYLPRLMVYHNQSDVGSELSQTFKVMERRLLKFIMTPAMIVAWLAGLHLAVSGNLYMDGWFMTKVFLVVILSAMHGINAKWVKEFDKDLRHRTTKFYRIANEIPTLLMILVVILVIIKPF